MSNQWNVLHSDCTRLHVRQVAFGIRYPVLMRSLQQMMQDSLLYILRLFELARFFSFYFARFCVFRSISLNVRVQIDVDICKMTLSHGEVRSLNSD